MTETESLYHQAGEGASHGNQVSGQTGMSLRDWFAAHAPTELDSSYYYDFCPAGPDHHHDGLPCKTCARKYFGQKISWRYYWADAMIAERNKK